MELIIGPLRYGDDLNRVVDYLRFLYKLGEELSKDICSGEAEFEYPYAREFNIVRLKEPNYVCS